MKNGDEVVSLEQCAAQTFAPHNPPPGAGGTIRGWGNFFDAKFPLLWKNNDAKSPTLGQNLNAKFLPLWK